MDSHSLDGEADFLLPWLLGSWFKVKLLPNQNQWQAQHLTARLLTTLGCLKVKDQSAAYCLWSESIFSIFLFCFFWRSSCCSITTYLGLARSYKSLRKKSSPWRRGTNVMNYFKVYVAQLQLITGESWVWPSVFCFIQLVSWACITHLTELCLWIEEQE